MSIGFSYFGQPQQQQQQQFLFPQQQAYQQQSYLPMGGSPQLPQFAQSFDPFQYPYPMPYPGGGGQNMMMQFLNMFQQMLFFIMFSLMNPPQQQIDPPVDDPPVDDPPVDDPPVDDPPVDDPPVDDPPVDDPPVDDPPVDDPPVDDPPVDDPPVDDPPVDDPPVDDPPSAEEPLTPNEANSLLAKIEEHAKDERRFWWDGNKPDGKVSEGEINDYINHLAGQINKELQNGADPESTKVQELSELRNQAQWLKENYSTLSQVDGANGTLSYLDIHTVSRQDGDESNITAADLASGGEKPVEFTEDLDVETANSVIDLAEGYNFSWRNRPDGKINAEELDKFIDKVKNDINDKLRKGKITEAQDLIRSLEAAEAVREDFTELSNGDGLLTKGDVYENLDDGERPEYTAENLGYDKAKDAVTLIEHFIFAEDRKKIDGKVKLWEVEKAIRLAEDRLNDQIQDGKIGEAKEMQEAIAAMRVLRDNFTDFARQDGNSELITLFDIYEFYQGN